MSSAAAAATPDRHNSELPPPSSPTPSMDEEGEAVHVTPAMYALPEYKRHQDAQFTISQTRDKTAVAYVKDPNEPVTQMNPFQSPVVQLSNVSIPFGISTKFLTPGAQKLTAQVSLDSEAALAYFILSDETALEFLVRPDVQKAFFPSKPVLDKEGFIRERFRALIRRSDAKYAPMATMKICVDPTHKDFVDLRIGEYGEDGSVTHESVDWKAIPATISPTQFIISLLREGRKYDYKMVVKQSGIHKAPNGTVGQSFTIRTLILITKQKQDNSVYYPGTASATKADLSKFGIDVSKMTAAPAAAGPPQAATAAGYGYGAPPPQQQPQGQFYPPSQGAPSYPPQYYNPAPAQQQQRPPLPGGFDASAFGYA